MKTLKYSLLLVCILLSSSLCRVSGQVKENPGPAQRTADINAASPRTMSALRAAAPLAAVNYLTDQGRQGFFTPDPADKNTPDDSAMTLVSRDGMRYKRVVDDGQLNVTWFGATGNGGTDDWYAIQKGIDYILSGVTSARSLYFPAGTYRISRPLLIARVKGSAYLHNTINLIGPNSAKNTSSGANIITMFKNTFAIGIQQGKGVQISGLGITGQFTFPNTLNAIQVDTLGFAEWTDPQVRQNTRSPYAGIVIDPFSDSTVYPKNSDMYPGLHAYCPAGAPRGGSTAVQIINCSIRNFIVGVMITPSNQQNGELIDVIDCDISNNKVGYAMGQAQSKECHVVRLKCWGPTHTLFDNTNYGFRHGDGAAVPMVDGVNIAGAVKQLCSIYAPSFGGSFHNVYAEQLFRIGFAGGGTNLSFEDCQFDFSTQDRGIPYPDFYVLGNGVNFKNCMLRTYPGVPGFRLVLSGTNDVFEGGITNAPPVAANVDNNAVYANPSFSNMHMYYSRGTLGNVNHGLTTPPISFIGTNAESSDPVYYGNTYLFEDPYTTPIAYKLTYHSSYERQVSLSGKQTLHVNKSNWTAWFTLKSPDDARYLQAGDFIVTSGLTYQDQYTPYIGATYPVGIVSRVDHGTVYLDNLAIGLNEGMSLSLWMDYFVNEKGAFAGNVAQGTNTITNVRGVFPLVGERPDMPMFPTGTYVTAVDQSTKTITLSAPGSLARSFSDFLFMNGYPDVEMYSSYSLPDLLKNGKTLLGGAWFYRTDTVNTPFSDRGYPFRGNWQERYRIFSNHFNGDNAAKLRFQKD